MIGFDRQICLGTKWLLSVQEYDSQHKRSGWSWAPDIPLNPQNTSEVVCTLSQDGVTIPHKREVCLTIFSPCVVREDGTNWDFSTNLDVAWRLAALTWLKQQYKPADRFIGTLVKELWDRMGSAGWSLGDESEISMPTTAIALSALARSDSHVLRDKKIGRVWKLFADQAIENDLPVETVAAILYVFCSPEMDSIRQGPSTRIIPRCVKLLLQRMEDDLAIHEVIFQRKDVSDRWRYLELPIALRSVAMACPQAIFDPRFRHQLATLSALQDCDTVHEGGFRISKYSMITTYATTLSLDALITIRNRLKDTVTADMALESLTAECGLHHSDPQKLIEVRGRPVITNSWFALIAAVIITLLAVVNSTTVIFSHMGTIYTHFVVTLSFLCTSMSWLGVISARLPGTNNLKIATIAFAITTAIAFPVLVFLL